jgi:cell division protein FtsQ
VSALPPRPQNRRLKKGVTQPDVLEGLDEEDLRAMPAVASERPKKKVDPERASAVLAHAKTVLGFLLVAAVSLGVAWGARRYVDTSPRFALKETVVEGNVRRPKEAILEEGGITLGKNVFAVDLDAAKRKIEADPWIAEATLGRSLPDTVLISVKERTAVALVALDDTYLVSPTGEVFKRVEPGDPSDLPMVTGLAADSIATDREGLTRSLQRALDIAADYAQSAIGTRYVLEEVHVEKSGGITLIVGQTGVSLVLGAPPYRRKLDECGAVLRELEKRGQKADAVLADNEARGDRVVARVRF